MLDIYKYISVNNVYISCYYETDREVIKTKIDLKDSNVISKLLEVRYRLQSHEISVISYV